MSFSRDVKNELKNKSFTSKKRNSKISDVSLEEKRSLLRDAFIEYGSVTDPQKCYMAEFVYNDGEKASYIKDTLCSLGMNARITVRKDAFVVYLEDGETISYLLGFIGAVKSLMEFENMRILKEMRSDVQRKVNFETANLQKTVNASVRQTEDILYIKEKMGFENLPPGLSEIAALRVLMPDATLKELSEAMTDPLGRSGVNHRLRKLSKIANDLRKSDEENQIK